MATKRSTSGVVATAGARPAGYGSDRRLVRGDRTRSKIVEAMVDLIDGGNPHPTSGQVAERAGVSVGLLRYHFSHVGLIVERAVALQVARHCLSTAAIPARGPLAVRIQATSHQRRQVLESLTPVLRVGYARSADSADLRRVLHEQRAVLRRQLAITFGPELASRGPEAEMVLELLDLAAGWPAWDTLRRHNRHSAAFAQQAMAFAITVLLG